MIESKQGFNDAEVLKKARVNPFSPWSIKGVVIFIAPDGLLHIESSMSPNETVDLLDQAMESIDGHRFPPETPNADQ